MLHSIRHYLSAYFFCGLFVLFLFLPLTNGFAQQLAVSSPARALYRGHYEHAKELDQLNGSAAPHQNSGVNKETPREP